MIGINPNCEIIPMMKGLGRCRIREKSEMDWVAPKQNMAMVVATSKKSRSAGCSIVSPDVPRLGSSPSPPPTERHVATAVADADARGGEVRGHAVFFLEVF